MGRAAAHEFDPDLLLRQYEVYDQAVDVVSCYQWLFTQVEDLTATVQHFERYPKVTSRGRDHTPDFTVLFTDQTGLAGEIARLARDDRSVESLCKQLERYALLRELPLATRGPTSPPQQHPVSTMDVLLLTPVKTVKDAAKRILADRMDDPNHGFTPPRRPVIVQFSQNVGEYVFLFWPNQNGDLHRGSRSLVYGDIDPFTCRPEWFTPIKAQFGFMNDPVPGLYMATRLWATVLPNRFWSSEEVDVPIAELVEGVREVSEGYGNVNDVQRGMRVLVAAGLARPVVTDKQWKVKRQSLRRSGTGEVHTAIAERIRKAKEATPLVPPIRTNARRRGIVGEQTLFDM